MQVILYFVMKRDGHGKTLAQRLRDGIIVEKKKNQRQFERPGVTIRSCI